jgi:hypothetical protein
MCWDDYVTDGTSFYRPLMNKVIQQAFTAEIRNIGLERDNNKTKLQRISASRALAIKKAWTCVEDDQLKGTVFEWEAPLGTHTLWTSPKKGTLVTCVRTPPNTDLCAILGQTVTLVSGKNENTIQIQFIKEKIMCQREHASYITDREPNCLWRITDLRPDANNHIMVTVNPIKRNNSKMDNRIIPIKTAKTLVTRHIEQRVVNTHNPSAEFPSISEHFSPPNRNMHGNFIPEDRSNTTPRRTHDADKLKTFLQIDPGHKITKNNGYIVLATTRKPTPRIGSIPVNHEHRGQPDTVVSNDEIIELLSYIGHNPQTNHQQGNDVGSTDTISCPRYSNSTHRQYIRISRQAWNILLKCYLCLRPKTDKPITIDFHNTWDALVKTFFATPFFWTYILDGEIRGANETKYVDIFTCSRMLIPVNIILKHWILACIDFEQKWIAWLDSIGETHEQETRLLFVWLTKEHSFNRPTIFDPAEWSLHSGLPPGTQAPRQSNDYDCGIFICLYAAFLDMRLPLSFSQHDTRNVRTWMTHEMIEDGKLLKMIHSVLHHNPLATATGNSETSSDKSMASKRSSESQLQGDIK